MNSVPALRFAASVVLGLVVLAAPALADELGDRVRNLYRPYEKEGVDAPSATDTIRPMASRKLGPLLDREAACARKNGVCGLGHDVIANGQDYKIDRVEVSPAEIQDDTAKVTARFRNMGGRFETRYEFVREGEVWKLDDIVALQPKDYRWRLTTLLAPKGRKAR